MECAEIDRLKDDLARIRSTDDSMVLARQVASAFESQLLATLSQSERSYSLQDLLNLIKSWGSRLDPAVRATSSRVTGTASFGIAENVVTNVVCRLMRILRAEALVASENSQNPSNIDSLVDEPIHRLLTGSAFSVADEKQEAPPMANLVEALTEYGYELDSLRDSLENRAAEFVATEPSASSKVMVLGRSRSTASFLRALSKFHNKRSPGTPISLLVAETGMFSSQLNQEGSDAIAFVGDLKRLGIQDVATVDDHAWYSLLVPRGHLPSAIRMVVISAIAVLADGSCLAAPGAWLLALAAQRGALPVIIVAPQYKLTPAFRVANAAPRFDILKPDLVNFIVTDIGTFSPAAVVKAMTELYGLPDASTCLSP